MDVSGVQTTRRARLHLVDVAGGNGRLVATLFEGSPCSGRLRLVHCCEKWLSSGWKGLHPAGVVCQGACLAGRQVKARGARGRPRNLLCEASVYVAQPCGCGPSQSIPVAAAGSERQKASGGSG